MTTRRRLLFGLVAALVATAVAAGLGELALRVLVGPPRALGRLYFRDEGGAVVGAPGREDVAMQEALRRGLVEPVPPEQTPRDGDGRHRPRNRFAPGAHFYLCYEDHDRLRADWLDDRGCVEVRINRFGLREREEIAPDNKAPDERRIVCVGDSMTFGWGIPVEQVWVRLLEDALRADGSDCRTVNCGASGALCVDEYEAGLRHRFATFQPDVVLVSICLNDLLPSSGLFVQGPAPPRTGLLLLDHLRAWLGRSPLDLDPAVDWVGLLQSLPREPWTQAGLYGPDKPFDAMWSQGTPQRALVGMRDFCRERGIALGVMVWPFLQGLGEGGRYPLRAMHEQLAACCGSNGIAFLDLLPALEGTPARELWVTPADMHANPRAQRLVLPSIERFTRQLLPH